MRNVGSLAVRRAIARLRIRVHETDHHVSDANEELEISRQVIHHWKGRRDLSYYIILLYYY